MKILSKIALAVPGTNRRNKYFSLKVRQEFSNEPSEFDLPKKIFAISDIEGNFTAFIKLLFSNNVIDKHLDWCFGDGHLVIVGDCFDRGEHVVECLWLIYSLEEKAKKSGGYVHFVLGNHEIMNLNGDWRYIHPKYAKSPTIPFTALYNGNVELWNWICTKNIMEKIGNVLFVHGGISKKLLQMNLSITEINALARPWYKNANIAFKDPLLNLIYNSEDSPFWYRGYYNSGVDEELIDDTLLHFGVLTIVTGHTMVDIIKPCYNGKVININTNHNSDSSAALYIKKGKFYCLKKDKKRTPIK